MAVPPPGAFDASRLRQTREAAGLSRPQLAQLIGGNAAAIKSWETKGICPSATNITKVANALGLTVADLYTPDSTSAGSLRDLRVTAGLSQAQLAQRLGVQQAVVSLWERSKTRPTWDEIANCAAIFGVKSTDIARAIDVTTALHGKPTSMPRAPQSPDDYHLTESSPHVIYEFEDPEGFFTITSPQFPHMRFTTKSEKPTLLELATLNEQVEATYAQRHNHFQRRCTSAEPGGQTYLIRWLDPSCDDTPAGDEPRDQVAEGLIASTDLWRAGAPPGPNLPLSTGEYLVVVVRPTDTFQFLVDQTTPGEPVTFVLGDPTADIGSLTVCFGAGDQHTAAWAGTISPDKISPDLPYTELYRHLRAHAKRHQDLFANRQLPTVTAISSDLHQRFATKLPAVLALSG